MSEEMNGGSADKKELGVKEKSKVKDNESDLHKDHRKRFRERILNTRDDDLVDYELLEAVLFYAIPRKNTNPVAHRLIKAFKSINGVLNANKRELKKVKGVGDATAEMLIIMGKLARQYPDDRQKLIRYRFGSEETNEYLRSIFEDIEYERVYMVYLDGNKQIIKKKLLFEGSMENVSVDLATLAKMSLDDEFKYSVCVHNHPSGIAKASYADRKTTELIDKMFEMLGMKFYDSVIVTENACYSIKNKETTEF
jgi:DNA repair protein RadC